MEGFPLKSVIFFLLRVEKVRLRVKSSRKKKKNSTQLLFSTNPFPSPPRHVPPTRLPRRPLHHAVHPLHALCGESKGRAKRRKASEPSEAKDQGRRREEEKEEEERRKRLLALFLFIPRLFDASPPRISPSNSSSRINYETIHQNHSA